jgi:hypothetical protein
MVFKNIALAFSLLLAQYAWADYAPYDKVFNLSAQSPQLEVKHHHDWSHGQGAINGQFLRFDVSSLTVSEKESGKPLFEKVVPALTYLWVSPDSNYVVGLSNIKLRNDNQIVVFNRNGDLLLRASVLGQAYAIESVSNWVHWYKEPKPMIGIAKEGGHMVLSVEDQKGVLRKFVLSSAPLT